MTRLSECGTVGGECAPPSAVTFLHHRFGCIGYKASWKGKQRKGWNILKLCSSSSPFFIAFFPHHHHHYQWLRGKTWHDVEMEVVVMMPLLLEYSGWIWFWLCYGLRESQVHVNVCQVLLAPLQCMSFNKPVHLYCYSFFSSSSWQFTVAIWM